MGRVYFFPASIRQRCADVTINRLDAAQAILDKRGLQISGDNRQHIRSLLARGCPPAKAVELALRVDRMRHP